MSCPNCSGIQHCPCKNCHSRNQYKITWIWVDGNGLHKCGYCGLTMPAWEWEDLEVEQLRKEGRWPV
jgi:hypothetical protein